MAPFGLNIQFVSGNRQHQANMDINPEEARRSVARQGSETNTERNKALFHIPLFYLQVRKGL